MSYFATEPHRTLGWVKLQNIILDRPNAFLERPPISRPIWGLSHDRWTIWNNHTKTHITIIMSVEDFLQKYVLSNWYPYPEVKSWKVWLSWVISHTSYTQLKYSSKTQFWCCISVRWLIMTQNVVVGGHILTKRIFQMSGNIFYSTIYMCQFCYQPPAYIFHIGWRDVRSV